MRLNHLSLTNFRNYARLELPLPDRLTVIQGANAQGKTNLLEAIHLLATGRSPRVVAERELVNWLALDSALPYARLVADAGENKDTQKLELVIELARNGGSVNGPAIRKQVRINDTPKRALDLVGRLRVVLFLPEDISLVAGTPGERRRYLDIALCQIAPAYCRALGEYSRIISQRNALLKRLREEGGDPRQLHFWNTHAVEQGSLLIYRRTQAVRQLDRLAAERHLDLTGGREKLDLAYLPSLDLSQARSTTGGIGSPEPDISAREPGPQTASPASLHPVAIPSGRVQAARQRLAEEQAAYGALSRDEIRERFAVGLHRVQVREIAAGTSLLGPHRDDMSFSVDGHDLRTFGSRGQQRTAALALKLAEVQLMQTETGENPLLLLDDVMSELDSQRRHTLLAALDGVAQAIVTTTDWSDFSPELLARSRKLHIEQGLLEPVE